MGSNLVLKLDVDKAVPLTPVDSSRYIACESGTLITLTSHPIKLPVGQYEIISDDVKIPDQITPGDICVYEISITFDVNPIRHEAVDFKSESFTVLPEQ